MSETNLKHQDKRRSEFQREKHLERISEMMLQEYTKAEIAEELGVSVGTIYNDIKEIEKRYQTSVHANRELYVGKYLAHYALIRKEAWRAWELSKDPAYKEVVDYYMQKDEESEQVLQMESGRKVTKEFRLPNNEYMRTIIQCLNEEKKLLGIDEPLKVDVKQTTINFDLLYSTPIKPMNPLEEKMQELRQKMEAEGRQQLTSDDDVVEVVSVKSQNQESVDERTDT